MHECVFVSVCEKDGHKQKANCHYSHKVMMPRTAMIFNQKKRHSGHIRK